MRTLIVTALISCFASCTKTEIRYVERPVRPSRSNFPPTPMPTNDIGWWCESSNDGACFRTPQGCAAMRRDVCINQPWALCFQSRTPDGKTDTLCIATAQGCRGLRNLMIANPALELGTPITECVDVY